MTTAQKTPANQRPHCTVLFTGRAGPLLHNRGGRSNFQGEMLEMTMPLEGGRSWPPPLFLLWIRFFFPPSQPLVLSVSAKTEEKVRSASEYKPVERIDRQGQETTRRISRSNVVTNISIPNLWPLQGTYRCRLYGRLWWPWAGSHLGQSIHTIHT